MEVAGQESNRKRADAEEGRADAVDIPGVRVVAVVESAGPPRPTIMVSDELAAEEEEERAVRRLRFFQPDEGGGGDDDGVHADELVSDHIQTEMLVHRNGRVDHGVLRQPYHCLMVGAMCCATEPRPLRRAAVLGHGAGALGSFLAKVMRAAVTAVDSDPAVVKVGRVYFGDQAAVHVSDAADFVLRADGGAYDAVLIDVNAAGHEPLAAPPKSLFSAEVVRALTRMTPMVIVNVLEGSEADRLRVGDAFATGFARVLWLTSQLCSNHIMVAGEALAIEPLQSRLGNWVARQHRPKSVARALDGVCSRPDASVAVTQHPCSSTASHVAGSREQRRGRHVELPARGPTRRAGSAASCERVKRRFQEVGDSDGAGADGRRSKARGRRAKAHPKE